MGVNGPNGHLPPKICQIISFPTFCEPNDTNYELYNCNTGAKFFFQKISNFFSPICYNYTAQICYNHTAHIGYYLVHERMEIVQFENF